MYDGKQISQNVSNHFTEELVNYKNLESDLFQSLKETFLKMDELMTTPESIEEIKT